MADEEGKSQRLSEILHNCRTLPDDLLWSGRHAARIHKARVEMPTVGVGQVYHEDATSGFSNYSPVKYSSNVSKAYYPGGQFADLLDSGIMATGIVSATTRDVDFQPNAGTMYEVHSIRMVASANAANRTGSVDWYDGTNTVPIWNSSGANIVANADFLIYPVDLSSYMTAGAILIGSPPLRAINTQYIRFSNTDLAAAETLTFRIRYDTREIGGLD